MTKIESYSTLQQSNDSSATKGTASNPYTENEFETMLDNGTWQGGFVENMGYCLGNVVVTASYPDSDSMDSYELWLSDDYTLLDGYSQSENETENTADGGNGNMQYRFGNTQSGTGDNVDINNYTGVNENKLNTLSANNGNSNIAKKFPSPTNKISKAGVRIFTQRVKNLNTAH